MATATNNTGLPTAPLDDKGQPYEPAPYFHEWDPTPHAIYPNVNVSSVKLADVVLGGTHQVEGFGRAEQRGTEAIRLDLRYLVTGSMECTARLILPVDHSIEVKRYYPEAAGRYHFAWVKLDSEGETYPAGLVPDYGTDAAMCCPRGSGQPKSDGLNPHGFEPWQTMCDHCADSWDIDHEVVRY